MRYLLLQVRDLDDPMRSQEVRCFARALGCETQQIEPFDLLSDFPDEAQLNRVDAVLIGGSGDYSAAGDGQWLHRTFVGLRRIAALQKPTLASCWGFQALARALGGRCIHDPDHAELGTIELKLTDAGRRDPLFGSLPTRFLAQAGHEDHVVQLPPGAILLASSDRVPNQAFKLRNAPIYCTQFHCELDRQDLLERIAAYPRYVQEITGVSMAEFASQCRDAPDTMALAKRFAAILNSSTQSG